MGVSDMVGSRVVNAIQNLNNGMAPIYIKTILENMSVDRVIADVVSTLTPKLVHISGWTDKGVHGESYDYAYIRTNSGDGRGDMDAWVTIGHSEGEDTVTVGIYGSGLQVVYNGVLLQKGISGLYLFKVEYTG